MGKTYLFIFAQYWHIILAIHRARMFKDIQYPRLHTAGVTGSIPVSPTKFEKPRKFACEAFLRLAFKREVAL